MMNSLQPVIPNENTVRLIVSHEDHFERYVESLMLMHDLLSRYAFTYAEPYFQEDEIHSRMRHLMGERSPEGSEEYGLPVREYHTYVSYALPDWELAQSVVERLRSAGMKTRVFPPHTEGLFRETYSEDLMIEWQDALKNTYSLVVLLTPRSKDSAEGGHGVAFELNYALHHGIRVFPLVLGVEAESVPNQLRFIPHYKTDGWLDRGFDVLIADLQQHLKSLGLMVASLPEEIQRNIGQNYSIAQQIQAAAEAQPYGQIDADEFNAIGGVTDFLNGLLQLYTVLRMLRQGPEFPLEPPQ